MADQPVGGSENTAGSQHPEYFGKKRFLVGHMDERIFGKNQIETSIGKWKFAGWCLHEVGAMRHMFSLCPLLRGLYDASFNIKAGNVCQPEFAGHMQSDAASAAADVECRPACQLQPGNNAVHLVRSTR